MGSFAIGAGYLGEYGSGLLISGAGIICVTGTYEPVVTVTGTFEPETTVTGSYEPIIHVTGDTEQC